MEGELLLELGRWAEARACFGKALDTEPDGWVRQATAPPCRVLEELVVLLLLLLLWWLADELGGGVAGWLGVAGSGRWSSWKGLLEASLRGEEEEEDLLIEQARARVSQVGGASCQPDCRRPV